MRRGSMMKRILGLLLCAAVLFTGFAAATRAAAKADAGDLEDGSGFGGETTQKQDKRIIVSLGDSYSSGEGNPDFYGQYGTMEQKRNSEDWLAHRSQNAWSGQLYLTGERGGDDSNRIYMNRNRGTNWYFVASSGAVTDHISRTPENNDRSRSVDSGEQKKHYNRDGISGDYYLPGQLNVFYDTPGLDRYDVDYVTISIGGNDVGFVDVLMSAAKHTILSTALYDQINYELDHFYDQGGTYYKIRNAYRRIAEAAPNATIVVVGYPWLLSFAGNIGCPLFNAAECIYIDYAVSEFNDRIRMIVKECQSHGMKIVYCSVEDDFIGHEAYSLPLTSYINPIMPLARSQDLDGDEWISSYSMHPNGYGLAVYANCVQEMINQVDEISFTPAAERETSEERDIVLMLDCSGSMEGTPMQETKKAAKNFIQTILKEDASIGIVAFSNEATMSADFNKDEAFLSEIVDMVYAYGGTNTGSALTLAEEMLDNSTAKKKFIVLMSDGLPNRGMDSENLIDYAEELKEKGILIYTLGFFQSVDYWDLSSAQNLMEKIASDACHFEVDDADNLVFFFEDIADQIRGTKYIYVRIACPVDVRVEYDGEVLSSTGNTRTSFGTVTFEEGRNGRSYRSGDDRTKILRLKEGAAYKIEIYGNGEGTMDCTVSFVDENGEYTDQRTVEEVAVTDDTVMESTVQRDKRTILKVDEDGDGRFDRNYDLGGPEESSGKTPLPVWAWVLIGVGGAAVIAGAILLIVLIGKKKRGSDKKGPRGGHSYAKETRFVSTGASESASFCPRCGTPNDSGSRFCKGCGALLRTEEAPTRTPAPEKRPGIWPEYADGAKARTLVTENKTLPAKPKSLWKSAEEQGGFSDAAPKTVAKDAVVGADTLAESPAEKPTGVLRSSMRAKPASMPLFKSESAPRPETAAVPEPDKTEKPAPEPDKTVRPAPETPAEAGILAEPPVKARPSGRAKFCLHCGEPIDEGARFCLNCGEPIETDDAPLSKTPEEPAEETVSRSAERPKFCLRCGEPIDEDARFCLNCGEKL